MTQPTLSTEKRKRKRGTKNNTKERGRRKMVEGKMRKINMMTLGPRLSIYLPTCLSIIHFLCVSLEIEGTRGLFCGTAPLLYSLVSFHATQSALYVLQSQTLGNQCDTCRSVAPTHRSHNYSLWQCVWPWHALASPSYLTHVVCKTGKAGTVFSLAWALGWHDFLCIINSSACQTLLVIWTQIRHIIKYLYRMSV